MRIWMRKALAAVLVLSLLCNGSVVLATEPTEILPTEYPTLAVPPTEVPAAEQTEAPAEEATEVPTEPKAVRYEVDTSTALYKVCASAASGLSYDQVLVYDATNDKLIFEDVLGNQTRQHSFMLYSTFSAINDYERLSNSSALLELSQWLDSQTGEQVVSNIDGIDYYGEITKIKAENSLTICKEQPK